MFHMLTSHLPGAIMVFPAKGHNLCFRDADGEAIKDSMLHRMIARRPTAAAAPVRMPRVLSVSIDLMKKSAMTAALRHTSHQVLMHVTIKVSLSFQVSK